MTSTDTQLTRDEIRSRLTTILTDEFAVPADEVTEDATFEELGLDSLDLVEVTLVVDEELGIRIPDERLGDITTTGDAVTVLTDLHTAEAA
jgi:acyl carrier protein